ncbi:MAG: hypothetical protein FI729_01300 [SAR202 cluster bacterium]|nr:hypothetical protein [SAR202 cluster bacterium]|tara:strand:- start:696 stop:1592 length:897 start_codon:yes stop_codon:yes gene_type:complete
MAKLKNKVEKTVTFEDGKEVKIYVQRPNNQTVKLADRHKSKAWNQAIQDDVLTKKELGVLMKKRGIWDEAKAKEEDDITRDIVKLERELYTGKDGKSKPKVSEGRDIAVEIRKARMELRELIAERISLEENTAESLADNARFDFLVANCTFYENGSRVYNSFEEYNNQSADEIAFAAATALGEILYNLDSSFEQNLPENKFLSKFGLVDDNLSLIDPNTGDTIDTKGNRIDEEGYLLDEDGNRVDREGNTINSEGFYDLNENYINDLIVKPKRTRRKTTKKEAPKETLEEAKEPATES